LNLQQRARRISDALRRSSNSNLSASSVSLTPRNDHFERRRSEFQKRFVAMHVGGVSRMPRTSKDKDSA
jgi:hypothetical protein